MSPFQRWLSLFTPPPTWSRSGSNLTHKGWFGLCPVYLGEIETDCPIVEPRRGIPDWWLMVNVEVQKVAIRACTWVNPYWFPTWKIKVTGEL